MANAALVIDNNALAGSLSASSQELAMPVQLLQTPHPSERWRSQSNTASFVLDKGALVSGDTVMLAGLTCGPNATIQVRGSTIDATGAAGDVFDTGVIANGAPQFDVDYFSFVHLLPAQASWRYLRFDIEDPDAAYVEAGMLLEGVRTEFAYNFQPGGEIGYVDLAKVSKTASGKTLVWPVGFYRTVNLSFPWVTTDQRYGVVERLDRVKGRRSNVLLIMDGDSANLPRSSIYGLVADITPVTFGVIFDLFGKQLRIDERI
jgi:hypothetical protein